MFGVYLHIPFCIKRCVYCDFITYAGKQDLMPLYVRALDREISSLGAARGGQEPAVSSVYFGGGTPSLLSAQDVRACLQSIEENFGLAADVEISLEANPGSVQGEYFGQLRAAGVNRLSLGVQSFSDAELQLLGRIHTVGDVYACVAAARSAGFDSISLDLMFGLPYQTLADWQRNVACALQLAPEHISLYGLTVEEGTPLAAAILAGRLPEPDPEIAADMFAWTIDALPRHGYEHYEISNWARSAALEARHNKVYWKNQPYLGIGAAAHSCAAGYRTANTTSIADYISRLNAAEPPPAFPFSLANEERIALTRFVTMQETMMLGLRLVREGVSTEAFMERFGEDLRVVFQAEIARLEKRGLLEWADFPDGPHLRLSPQGVMLGNQAFMEFV